MLSFFKIKCHIRKEKNLICLICTRTATKGYFLINKQTAACFSQFGLSVIKY